jgi:hypothetical protein
MLEGWGIGEGMMPTSPSGPRCRYKPVAGKYGDRQRSFRAAGGRASPKGFLRAEIRSLSPHFRCSYRPVAELSRPGKNGDRQRSFRSEISRVPRRILACGNSKPVTTFAEVWTHLGSFVCAETLPGGDCNDWGCWARLRVWTHQISRCVLKFPTAGARFA